jgi:cholesterol transport system auxiliary component
MIAKQVFTAPARNLLALPRSASASLLLAALVLLSSCSILPKREPMTIYEPARATVPDTAGWPQAKWSLLVARPAAGQLLDNDRILVRPTPGAVTVYKGASWSDALPELVQTALLRRFEDSGRIMAVARPGGSVRGDFQLLTELRAFDSVYVQPGQPQVQLELFARIVHSPDGQVVAARSFRQTEPASGESVGLVVEAFSRALARLSDEVAIWTLQSGNGQAQDHSGAARPR